MSKVELLSTSIRAEAEARKPHDAVLVFGSGPIVDIHAREQAEKVGTLIGEEDINFWSKKLADASTYLVKRNVAAELLIMGGRTGGPAFKSEAELIGERIVARGVPRNTVQLEQSSTNTLENLVNVLNLYIDNPEIANKYRNLGILAQHYHLPRVRLLMDLFEIPYVTAFSSEKVARFAAIARGDQEEADEIDKRLDTNEDSKLRWSPTDYIKNPGYYKTQKGTETLGIVRRFQENDVLSRELLITPEYWLMYVGRLHSENRARSILSKIAPEVLERFAINLADPIEKIRTRLSSIQRRTPDYSIEIPRFIKMTPDEYNAGAFIGRVDAQVRSNTVPVADETPHT